MTGNVGILNVTMDLGSNTTTIGEPILKIPHFFARLYCGDVGVVVCVLGCRVDLVGGCVLAGGGSGGRVRCKGFLTLSGLSPYQ